VAEAVKHGSVVTAWIMFIVDCVDAVIIDDGKELPRSTAEASNVAPVQWVNPLTKEQLQQAFIYLLQVSMLHILLMVNSVTWLYHFFAIPIEVCFNGCFPDSPGFAKFSVFFLQLFQKRTFKDRWHGLFLLTDCPFCHKTNQA